MKQSGVFDIILSVVQLTLQLVYLILVSPNWWTNENLAC